MLHFHQTETTFFVKEELLYPPEGHGPFVFACFRKRAQSTQRLKQKLSEITGVPLAHIGHAGLKDHLSTSEQWLSWPADRQRQAPPQRGEGFEIIRISRGTQSLKPGLVAANHFRLILKSGDPQADAGRLTATTRFPNFFGPQRFGSAARRLDRNHFWPQSNRKQSKGKRAMAVSVAQAYLFNQYLQRRLDHFQLGQDELWQKRGAKRFFQEPLDAVMRQRFETGDVSPSGPMYGYKVQLTQAEIDFLAEFGKTSEDFRTFGKIALGTRRALFVEAENVAVTCDGPHLAWQFSLPSGAYATVYLACLLQKTRLTAPIDQWPNYNQPVYFSEVNP